jgi:hypothetical protein
VTDRISHILKALAYKNNYSIISFIHSSMALQPFVGPWPLLQFRNLFYTDSKTSWMRDQPVARPLPTHRTIQTQIKRTQTSMPRVGFETTIPAFERAKIIHALDRAATMIGQLKYRTCIKLKSWKGPVELKAACNSFPPCFMINFYIIIVKSIPIFTIWSVCDA